MAAKDPAEMMAAHDEEIISLLKAILAAQRDLLAAFGNLGPSIQAAVQPTNPMDIAAALAAADPRMARRMSRGNTRGGGPLPPPPLPQEPIG